MRPLNRTSRARRIAAGFTLIEVLASTLTLMLVIIATSSLISNGMLGTRMGNWDNVARASAMREMERLKALRWADLSALPVNAPITEPDTNFNGIWDLVEPALVGTIPNMAGRRYVANYDADGNGAPDPTIKLITVSVSVYGNSNPLVNLLQPFVDTVAYAQGGGGGGGSARSVWRITMLVSQKGLSE